MNAGRTEHGPAEHNGHTQPINHQFSADLNIGQKNNKETVLREVKFSSNHNGISVVIPIKLHVVQTHAVVDTAAQVSIISEDITKQIKNLLKPTEEVLLSGRDKIAR